MSGQHTPGRRRRPGAAHRRARRQSSSQRQHSSTAQSADELSPQQSSRGRRPAESAGMRSGSSTGSGKAASPKVPQSGPTGRSACCGPSLADWRASRGGGRRRGERRSGFPAAVDQQNSVRRRRRWKAVVDVPKSRNSRAVGRRVETEVRRQAPPGVPPASVFWMSIKAKIIRTCLEATRQRPTSPPTAANADLGSVNVAQETPPTG